MNEPSYKGPLHKEVSKLSNINPRFHRISSMLLDHVVLCIVIVPLSILIFVLVINFKQSLNNWIGTSLMFFPFFIYLNKDFLNGKSPAKRILGYQVIDRKTEKPASELQCFIRNLTICLIWPIEVVVGYINPERRIGDFLANTKVTMNNKEKLNSLWRDLKKVHFKAIYIIITIIGIIYFYGLSFVLPQTPIMN
ncbi:RDD family protein [Flagellimonas sp.]|uniref:RDD family protein n=1 Tax=Flagellimonas sp. TaxID=2058762 RepID=UPI003B595921